jgi:hypothetical protein
MKTNYQLKPSARMDHISRQMNDKAGKKSTGQFFESKCSKILT